jgi:hypothetical protein
MGCVDASSICSVFAVFYHRNFGGLITFRRKNDAPARGGFAGHPGISCTIVAHW